MNGYVVVLSVFFTVASAQFFQTLPVAIQPPPLQQNSFQPTFQVEPRRARVQPHPAVVLNAENEAKLPAELRSNFYNNPRVAQALAKDSWFGPGEEQVINREADKIPRSQVFKLFKQAGFIRRR